MFRFTLIKTKNFKRNTKMKYIIIFFLLTSTTVFSQSKIDSVLIYSSSFDFYMGEDTYDYSILKFPKEVDPIKITNSDTLALIASHFSKLIFKDSTKRIPVFFIVEVYKGNEKSVLAFSDKKLISFDGVLYKKNKRFYELCISLIEERYNKLAPIEEL